MNTKHKHFSEDEINQLASMYKNGVSIYKICRELNRSETSVKNHLKKLNLFIPSKQIIVDTPELNLIWLYWILIPLFILKANANPMELIIFTFFS
jgi:hypothetical protein